MADQHHTDLPLVALVGRPNVGKSTLFNRLTETRLAIVEDRPGVTRDRRYGTVEWAGGHFRVVDTGGLDLAAIANQTDVISKAMFGQTERALHEADIIVMVTDARAGTTPRDRETAELLRRYKKPLLWVANKVDRAQDEAEAFALYELGADHVFAVSAEHGRGISELLDALVEQLGVQVGHRKERKPSRKRRVANEEGSEAEIRPARADGPISVAVVGRPNAGKSSLINRLLGEERMLVHSEAGTTRDPIDSPFRRGNRDYILIDTAGIRRRARIDNSTEKISVALAEKAIERADVCVLLIDAHDGVAEQDAKIVGLCDDTGRALVIALNKMDLVESKQDSRRVKSEIERKIQFVPWAEVVEISAKTGDGVNRLLQAVQKSHAAFHTRVSTAKLNRWFRTIVEKHPPPVTHGQPLKLYFIQQPKSSPPTFVLSVNHPKGLHFSYRRYLINELRKTFHLDGTPLRIVAKPHHD